jgi:predicted alpha/beta-hydrolase family hydrolase
VGTFNLSERVEVSYLADGDHSFKPRKASGATLEANLDQIIEHSITFIRKHL